MKLQESRVNLFAAFEHTNEFLDVTRTGFRFLASLNSKQNRVTIGTVQVLEETLRFRTGFQRGLKSSGTVAPLGESYADSHRPLLLACLDRLMTRRHHATACDQLERLLAIDF